LLKFSDFSASRHEWQIAAWEPPGPALGPGGSTRKSGIDPPPTMPRASGAKGDALESKVAEHPAPASEKVSRTKSPSNASSSAVPFQSPMTTRPGCANRGERALAPPTASAIPIAPAWETLPLNAGVVPPAGPEIDPSTPADPQNRPRRARPPRRRPPRDTRGRSQ